MTILQQKVATMPQLDSDTLTGSPVPAYSTGSIVSQLGENFSVSDKGLKNPSGVAGGKLSIKYNLPLNTLLIILSSLIRSGDDL